MAVAAPKGLIIGILWIIAINTKYTFAKRINWSIKALGKNVIQLYLVVDILLSLKNNSSLFPFLLFI